MSKHRPPGEVHCTHDDRPRRALGLCAPCYDSHYRRARKALGRPLRSSMSVAQRARL